MQSFVLMNYPRSIDLALKYGGSGIKFARREFLEKFPHMIYDALWT